jgi:hypothetical protein
LFGRRRVSRRPLFQVLPKKSAAALRRSGVARGSIAMAIWQAAI